MNIIFRALPACFKSIKGKSMEIVSFWFNIFFCARFIRHVGNYPVWRLEPSLVAMAWLRLGY